jgi:MYXO-CTERM domain-containing protein
MKPIAALLRIVLAIGWLLTTFGAAPASSAASTSATAFVPGFGQSGEDFGIEDASVVLVLPSGEFEASAAVGYGALVARARYEVDEFSRSLAFGSTIASGTAQALDTITITGGTGAGTLLMTFSLEGAGFESDPGIVRGQYLFYANTPSESFSRSRSIHGLLVGDLVRDPIPFVFGEPFSLALGLTVEIEQIQEGDPPPYRPLVAGFEYDVLWTGAAVLDALGDPVAGFAITAESGTAYPVSEGGESGLALASVAALGLVCRRRPETTSRPGCRSASRSLVHPSEESPCTFRAT